MGQKVLRHLLWIKNLYLDHRYLVVAMRSGLRSGTENVPAIVGFGKACELSKLRMDRDHNTYYKIAHTPREKIS